MEFLTDENIKLRVVAWLARAGHNAKAVPKGISDEEVARLASACAILSPTLISTTILQPERVR